MVRASTRYSRSPCGHSRRAENALTENDGEAGSTSEGEARPTVEEKEMEIKEQRASEVHSRTRRPCSFHETISEITEESQKAPMFVERKKPQSKGSQAIRRVFLSNEEAEWKKMPELRKVF